MSIHAPTLLLTQRVWGPDPWAKVDRSLELAGDSGPTRWSLHPPFRWQRDYATDFVDGVALREHDSGIALAVENMFPWRARNREMLAYLPHWDPVSQPYDHVTLDLSHTATAGSDAMEMAATLGPGCGTSTWPTAAAPTATSTWSRAAARSRVPSCSRRWRSSPSRGPSWWRSAPAGAAWTSARPTWPRRSPSPGCTSPRHRHEPRAAGPAAVVACLSSPPSPSVPDAAAPHALRTPRHTGSSLSTRTEDLGPPYTEIIAGGTRGGCERRAAPGTVAAVQERPGPHPGREGSGQPGRGRRFVPGERTADAVRAATELARTGRRSTIDFLGEDTTDLDQARATRDAYVQLLAALSEAGLTQDGRAEVSVKLSAVGQYLPGDGHKIALDHAREICQAAANAGTTVTLDMEDHTTTDATLETLRELRQDFPSVGAVLQAYLHRTEADCRDLAVAGSRVRLCKGAYKEPESVAFQDSAEVDKSYVRCLKVLMAGEGYPMVASHDPRLVEIAGALAARHHRDADSFEYQMLYGIRPEEQKRLADRGDQMRVYIPYGRGVVRLPHAPDGRAPRQHRVLPARARDQGLSRGRPIRRSSAPG